MTLGLALVVIDAAMLTHWLTTAIEVDGFWSTVLGAIVISIES